MQSTTSRSSHSSIVYPVAPLTSAYVQPHQPQRIVYTPITTVQTSRNLQPNYIYTRNQKSVRQMVPVQIEGKINTWQVKNKVLKNQQYCQHQFLHPSNPFVIYKQPVNNFLHSQNQTNAPVVLTSSGFPSNPYAGKHYNHPNIAVLHQPYYKTPDLQHSNSIYTNQSQHVNSYYVTATNTSNLQNVQLNFNYDQSNLQQFKTVSTISNNQMPILHDMSSFPNVRMGLVLNESTNEKVTAINCSENKLTNNYAKTTSSKRSDWFSPSFKILPSDLCDDANDGKDTQNIEDAEEDKLSETSSTNFDFTIEAEKMVSALCDVKSPNDLKQDSKSEKQDEEASETIRPLKPKNEDAKKDVPVNKSVCTKIPEFCKSEKKSDLIRNTALWGCTEAEIVLNSSRYCQDSKYAWLTNLSTATKTAINKSSSAFPVFGGDRILVHDLINALLRISNGWLALDNYLNKQYFPSLEEKYDTDLSRSFQNWESNTNDLLKSIIQTFRKIEQINTTDPEHKQQTLNLTFPGDVSMYTHCDLFDQFATHSAQNSSIAAIGLSPISHSTFSSSYFSQTPHFQYINCQQSSIKESKLRTKWTITEKATKQDKKSHSTSPANGFFQQSWNTEFSQLKNKIVDSGACSKSKESGNQKLEFSFANKNAFSFLVEESKPETSFQTPTIKNALHSQNSVFTDATNTNHKHFSSENNKTDDKHLKYSNSKFSTDSVYLRKISSNNFELIPKTKMTLLSQIEPNATDNPENQKEMSAHLSAWYASMRNTETTQHEKAYRTVSSRHLDVAKNALDLSKQLKMDTSKQLLSLKNMQSIQKAPWSAFSLLNGSKNSKRSEECESTENLRVYMKPGSYNVPKKRYQKKSKNYQCASKNANRLCKSQNKELYSVPSSLSTLSSVSSENLNSNNNQSQSSNNSLNSSLKKDDTIETGVKLKESTWKSACASAEILLKALNMNKRKENFTGRKKDDESLQKTEDSLEQANASDYFNSSGESEEEFCLSSKQNVNVATESLKNKQAKNNVKTDSWLLKTLKLKDLNKTDQLINVESGESFNSVPEKNCQNVKKSSVGQVSEARPLTYSDMTRKEMQKTPAKNINEVIMTPKKSNSKINESKKAELKKNSQNVQVIKSGDKTPNKCKSKTSEETGLENMQLMKRRKVKIKEDGFLPINSKKKPALSTLTLCKLETIYQTIYEMEESCVLKCPSSINVVSSTSIIMVCYNILNMDDDQKVVKCPIFLETIGYKLKSRSYNKVENFSEDFQKIVYNFQLYHKNNDIQMKKIDIVFRKLEDLFEEHFSKKFKFFIR